MRRNSASKTSKNAQICGKLEEVQAELAKLQKEKDE